MASLSLEDGEFWLPPKFLADDDGFMEKRGGFSDVSSNLSSPVESVVGSSETESEEDDYIAGLTIQMARSTLENGFVSDSSTAKFSFGSPESPLESGCGYSPASLPPTTLDLFFAAAEVARRRMNDEAYMMNRSKGLLFPPNKPSPVPVRTKNSNSSVEYYHQLQAAQFHHLRKQQMMKQQSYALYGNQRKTTEQYQRRLYQSPSSMNNGLKSENTQSAWLSLQESQNQHNGSGMRAVFLDNPGARKECAGTGVFLPRQVGNHSSTRKKPACSSVLVPAKVIQALNLNLNAMQVHHQSQPRLSPRLDPALKFHYNQKVQPMMNQELHLPNEWTY